MRNVVSLSLGLSVALLVGCGGKDYGPIPETHEGVLDEMAKVTEDMNLTLNAIRTKDDAVKYKEDFEKMTKRRNDLLAQARKLGEPDAATRQQLEAKVMKLKSKESQVRERLQKLPKSVRDELKIETDVK